jgi:hypothetical protein
MGKGYDAERLRVHSQTLTLNSSQPSGLAPPGKMPTALVVPMPVSA